MYKKYIKRIIDIIISLIALVILSPVFIIVSILIKTIDRGQVIYKQTRTGKNANNFRIYKFRTMKGGKITKLGKFLRSTSLDEIPQFYNVLKGDMSLIGPRPWIPDYYERFSLKQKKRNNIRPGLIGLAQVNGRKEVDILEKIDYDLKYIDKLSFIEDIKILIKSLKVIIKKEDIKVGNDYIQKELDKLEEQSDKETNVGYIDKNPTY